ncbi:antitoxin [Candidatus Paracaedibacter acanthamoebae]|uniref:Antitoxin n=1 Tax=Candidatus Odyssella acanthamoebae TaxID=91604 RepID=A0A077AZB5_9PROT|nr:antitoxin [Candidatus Paracaedibacter acanthamoebae]
MKNSKRSKANLYKLVDETHLITHQATLIKGKRYNAVLVSEEDWRSIQETLHLLSIPDTRESIREGLETPIEENSKTLEW